MQLEVIGINDSPWGARPKGPVLKAVLAGTSPRTSPRTGARTGPETGPRTGPGPVRDSASQDRAQDWSPGPTSPRTGFG